MCLIAGLVGPDKGSVSEVDDDPGFEKRLPQRGNLLALADGIGRDESRLDLPVRRHEARGLAVPAGHIVEHTT